jgi:hypothetical protein
VIDAMTLAEAAEIFDYWRESPPSYLMIQTIAALLGWRPGAGPADGDAAARLAAAPPSGLVVTRAGEGLTMPAPIFDVGEMRLRNAARIAEAGARTAPKPG